LVLLEEHFQVGGITPGGNASFTLGFIEDECPVKPLIAALEDESSVVRKNAILALDKRVRRMSSQGWGSVVRKNAVLALGSKNYESAVELLSAALKDKERDVKIAAADALGSIRDARAVEPLIAALEDKDIVVRQRAIFALGSIKDARAAEPLIAALNDKDSLNDKGREFKLAACAAADALGVIGDPRAVEPLIAALKNENAGVRMDAAKALGKIGDKRAVEPLIDALKDNSRNVREHSAEALGEIRDTRAVEPLVHLFIVDEDIRSSSAVSLMRITGRYPDDLAKWRKWWAGRTENTAKKN
jgi:HEAT repeat protein